MLKDITDAERDKFYKWARSRKIYDRFAECLAPTVFGMIWMGMPERKRKRGGNARDEISQMVAIQKDL